MEQEEYLIKRVQKQINWHSKKAGVNKKWYLALSTVSLFLSILVSATIKTCYLIPFYLSLMVPLCTGILTLFNFQNKWKIYRNTAELLKKETFLFQTKTGLYSIDDNFNNFVTRIENIISNVNQDWTNILFESNESKNDSKGTKG